jgi:hypothetical protein
MVLGNDLTPDVGGERFRGAKVDNAEIAAVTKGATKRPRRAQMRASEGGWR